jgi:hypothetical protein
MLVLPKDNKDHAHGCTRCAVKTVDKLHIVTGFPGVGVFMLCDNCFSEFESVREACEAKT